MVMFSLLSHVFITAIKFKGSNNSDQGSAVRIP